MELSDFPDVMTEPSMSLARRIESSVTRGLGYNTNTDFNSMFYDSENAKNSERGLQAHLAHLEMNRKVQLLRNYFWLIQNAPDSYQFPLVKSDGVKYEKLSPNKRKKAMKDLYKSAKHYEYEFKSAKSYAENSIEKIMRSFPILAERLIVARLL